MPLPPSAASPAAPPVRSATAPRHRHVPAMRRVEILSLAANGDVSEAMRLVPAFPVFDEAFAALARGTILPTERGHVAVEDLLPGDRVRCGRDGFEELVWRGSTMIVPNAAGQDPAMGRLTRIAADSMGIARPMPDLVLGPKARLVHRAPGIRVLTGQEAALIPAADFVDGIQVVTLTPATPVQVFHLGFRRHVRLVANGVEIESHHPGPAHLTGLKAEMLQLYLSCFPHVARLEDFGAPMLPRLRRADLDLFDVA